SIYTHSIPWALHTKSIAKAQRRTLALLGNRLDTCVRKLQSDQTVGIPIGPDCSLAIAEIVLCAVDSQMQTSGFMRRRSFRFMDDYEASFDSLAEAEEALGGIQASLASYELTPNPTKTGLKELPE